MTTFNPPTLQESRSLIRERSGAESPEYALKWRQKQLLVLRSQPQTLPPHLPPLTNERWLIDCLNHSPIRLVRVDAGVGETGLRFWANACERSGKTLYLRLPSTSRIPKRVSVSWGCKRLLDLSLASLMLLLLSPLMATIAVLIKFYTPGPVVFQQWRVGQRGKLFRVFKFRTMTVNAEQNHHQVMAGQMQTNLHKRDDDPRVTSLGKWLRKYSLDELPQLFNVLRGEMSLVGPRPWALYDAVRIRPDGLQRLNALPGVTGAWQIEARSHLLDIDMVNDRDLEYLRNWSLAEDLRILLRTVPKVLSGFGAC
jgi:lipopolysaccharide/colanic/teichoic acid biosynthesis glycosyltransferase